jgi:hypothetical protein
MIQEFHKGDVVRINRLEKYQEDEFELHSYHKILVVDNADGTLKLRGKTDTWWFAFTDVELENSNGWDMP